MRIALLVLLLSVTPVVAQQKTAVSPEGPKERGLAEPKLPVVYNKVCPFEGCVFRKWKVRLQSKMYSTWRSGRILTGTLRVGEKVDGVTGVLVILKPDRFVVRQPIQTLSLKVGDIVLQYAEWGEGAADLWVKGVWHKNFDLGESDDDQLVLSEETLRLVEHGRKQWWVQVRRKDGRVGWVLAHDNFDNFEGWDQLGSLVPRRNPEELCSQILVAGY